MSGYATDATEQQDQMRRDNAPKLIRQAPSRARWRTGPPWLARKYHDEYRSGFVADEEHVPVTSRSPRTSRRSLDRLREDNDIYRAPRAADARQ